MKTGTMAALLAALLASPLPAIAQGQPRPDAPAAEAPEGPALNDGSRFAQACESSARRALVASFTFDLTDVVDNTAAGSNTVEIVYDATSRNSGRVYHQVFSCFFQSVEDPDNIVLDAAMESGRPYGPQSLRALNQMLQADGFQTPED